MTAPSVMPLGLARERERERTQILSDIGSTVVHSSELAIASYLAALQEGGVEK